jgi:Mn-dependent DtxR family transcriptional regulator
MIVYTKDLAKELGVKQASVSSMFLRLKKCGLEKSKKTDGYNSDDVIMAIDTRLGMLSRNQFGEEFFKKLKLIKQYLLKME